MMNRDTKIKIAASIALSAFWALFLWNFWEKGVYALGLNAFLYLSGLAGLFVWAMHKQGVDLRRQLFWLVPIGMIIVSFLLYENPVQKVISLMVLPVLFAGFYNYSLIKERERIHWDARLITHLAFRSLSLLGKIGRSISAHVRLLVPPKGKGGLAGRIALGVVLMLIISFTAIVPLLSSADSQFAAVMKGFTDWFQEILSTTAASKLMVGFLLSVLTTAGLLAWGRGSSMPSMTRRANRPIRWWWASCWGES